MMTLCFGDLAFAVSTRKGPDNCSGITVDGPGTLEDLHGYLIGVTQRPNGPCVGVDLSDNVRSHASRPQDTQGLIDDADQQQRDNDHDGSTCDESEHPIRHLASPGRSRDLRYSAAAWTELVDLFLT